MRIPSDEGVLFLFYTKIIYKIICINDITFRFTHLAFANKEPWMTKYLFW